MGVAYAGHEGTDEPIELVLRHSLIGNTVKDTVQAAMERDPAAAAQLRAIIDDGVR